MDNQNSAPNPTPPTENVPAQNPAVEETPSSQVYTAPQPPPSPKSFLSSKIVLLIVILLILLSLGGTYLALNSKPKPAPIVSKEAPTSTPSPTPTTDPTANWKVYTNTEVGYQISYPQNISIRESRLENVESVELGSFLPPAKIQHVALLIFPGDGKETMSISSAINISPNYGFNAKLMAEKIAEISAYPAKVAELQLSGVQTYGVRPEPTGKFSNWSISTIFVNGKRPSSAYVIDVAVASSKEEIVNQILSTFQFSN